MSLDPRTQHIPPTKGSNLPQYHRRAWLLWIIVCFGGAPVDSNRGGLQYFSERFSAHPGIFHGNCRTWKERLNLSPGYSRTTPFHLLSSVLPIEIDISYWRVPSQG